MTTKELIKSFVDQALLFNTDDKVTKWLGAGAWIVLAIIFTFVFLMLNWLL